MPPKLSFQPEQNDWKQSIILYNSQIPQTAQNELFSLLEKDYDSIVSKSAMDVGRTNHFQMDIPTTGMLKACKPHPIH